MLELHSAAYDCANSAILISGSARSGTTIVGKLIHSFTAVEYVFEPPALISLFPIMDNISRQHWNYLYEAYLYEEFLINAVSGRAINTNLFDDSSIFVTKSGREISTRLGRSWPKAEAVRLAASRRTAYKIPNIVAYIPELRSRYPRMTVVIMLRDAVETIHSLIAKHVFTPNHPSASMPWPFRRHEGELIPYWVKRGDESLWKELSEIDRCAYYYICMSNGSDAAEYQIVLKYSDLVTAPLAAAESLADFLGVSFGEQTLSVIKTIKPAEKYLNREIIDSISEQFRAQVVEYSLRAE